LDEAEAVCADTSVSASAVLDLLARLVDKSLVVVDQRDGNTRYRLLEPIRQYAEERLVASGEHDAVRRRHALAYLAFAEARAQDTNIGGPRRFPATRELACEYANIRGALAWTVESSETQLGLRLAGSLLFFWQVYGPVSEGIAWIERLLRMPGADESTAARAWVLLAAAYLAQLHGDFAAASAFCHEGALLAQHAAEPSLEWIAHLFLSNHGFRTGDLEDAEQCANKALGCARAAGRSRTRIAVKAVAWLPESVHLTRRC
jgi:predicted ATPase